MDVVQVVLISAVAALLLVVWHLAYQVGSLREQVREATTTAKSAGSWIKILDRSSDADFRKVKRSIGLLQDRLEVKEEEYPAGSMLVDYEGDE